MAAVAAGVGGADCLWWSRPLTKGRSGTAAPEAGDRARSNGDERSRPRGRSPTWTRQGRAPGRSPMGREGCAVDRALLLARLRMYRRARLLGCVPAAAGCPQLDGQRLSSASALLVGFLLASHRSAGQPSAKVQGECRSLSPRLRFSGSGACAARRRATRRHRPADERLLMRPRPADQQTRPPPPQLVEQHDRRLHTAIATATPTPPSRSDDGSGGGGCRGRGLFVAEPSADEGKVGHGAPEAGVRARNNATSEAVPADAARPGRGRDGLRGARRTATRSTAPRAPERDCACKRNPVSHCQSAPPTPADTARQQAGLRTGSSAAPSAAPPPARRSAVGRRRGPGRSPGRHPSRAA